MKFLKPILVLVIVVALTYTVSASNVSFNQLLVNNTKSTTNLPVNGDLLFALSAIVSLGGYLVIKK